MTTNFRPSTLPDLPADLRVEAKALADRLAAIGYNDDARTLKGVTKCWTAIRAAKAAASALYTFDSAKVETYDALEADLATFVERVQGASMKAAQAEIDARTGRSSARVSL
jgi:hypothetical protein